MCLRQTLSRHMGVAGFSEAKTQASGCFATSSIQACSCLAVFGGMAAVRVEEFVFGVSMSPR